jgi:hypothetical protein
MTPVQFQLLPSVGLWFRRLQRCILCVIVKNEVSTPFIDLATQSVHSANNMVKIE